jgi:NAD(P)-dependent dehydrogenase (short-subunit alcohol dehydrogenase family)
MTQPQRDVEGKTCVVTGANTGIGRVTARELARRGARVVLACRSRERTEPALEEARRAGGSREAAEFVRLDLGSLASVREAATAILAACGKIDVLVNNAGLAGKRGLTEDGFELAFGVNHLGHFLLTHLLLERIRASAPARIVTVASKAHFDAPGIDFHAVRKRTATYMAYAEYQVSKLANVLFSAELGRRLAGSGITTYALHPGVIATEVWREVPWPIRWIYTRFLPSAEVGARTSLWCATAPELEAETGEYYDDKTRYKPSVVARDETLARELWRRSLEWCGLGSERRDDVGVQGAPAGRQ